MRRGYSEYCDMKKEQKAKVAQKNKDIQVMQREVIDLSESIQTETDLQEKAVQRHSEIKAGLSHNEEMVINCPCEKCSTQLNKGEQILSLSVLDYELITNAKKSNELKAHNIKRVPTLKDELIIELKKLIDLGAKWITAPIETTNVDNEDDEVYDESAAEAAFNTANIGIGCANFDERTSTSVPKYSKVELTDTFEDFYAANKGLFIIPNGLIHNIPMDTERRREGVSFALECILNKKCFRFSDYTCLITCQPRLDEKVFSNIMVLLLHFLVWVLDFTCMMALEIEYALRESGDLSDRPDLYPKGAGGTITLCMNAAYHTKGSDSNIGMVHCTSFLLQQILGYYLMTKLDEIHFYQNGGRDKHKNQKW
eukprot:CAMPEP_0114405492 /NCGR_PEP_ID=MMETSP0102-20121206/20381_1 /TAXON_ID=38822 ORGANISM="Pteridomonas danica, Strain PT" /NCGR_SAMPLE_ID=MMETSP0102 /ASSEMBLY_ACC=CAM_ASM_000212 /LENGTH=367 /DNA_ID=CAMNT_0001570783 /DNA_START=167 /DNA_END=1267 /DNA_ORIENTATION=+